MLCQKCGNELPESESICPTCNFNVKDTTLEKEDVPEDNKIQETETSPDKVKKNKRKNVIIVIVIVLALILSYAIYSHQKRSNQYLWNLEGAASDMLEGASEAEKICNLIGLVWHNSIFEEYDIKTDKYTCPNGYFHDDFNYAIANLYADPDFVVQQFKLNADIELVELDMKSLNNPPQKYSEAYTAIKEYYSAFLTLTNLAINQSGNYNTYTSNVNDAVHAIIECDQLMRLYL